MLLFYDIEIFKHDALVVFKDIDKNVIEIYHNDFEGILSTIKGKTLVGYNNYNYDDYILTKMMKKWTPEQLKELNDKIIKNENFVKDIHSSIRSLDCYQQIDVSKPGLKKIEGNMGKMILESSVEFDLDRRLTNEELEEITKYCCYDVDTTIEVFKLRESYFKTKEMLVEKLGNDKASRWNTTTISANLLCKNKINRWSSVRVSEDTLQLVEEEVREMWLQANSFAGIKKKTTTINKFNCEIQFGFGGLHGAPKQPGKWRNVKLLDVQSMYPNIIILLNALGGATNFYKNILEKRIEIKHINKLESDALKLILNSVYGNLNNQYSTLHNPRAAISVCVFGQIALYNLCERLSESCKIININTDGVAFTTNSEDYIQIAKEWERDFGLILEEDVYDLFIQKDVNNYIAIRNGQAKCKGGDVNNYNHNNYFGTNNARIIDMCVVENLVNGVDVIDTLMKHLDRPHLYQYILRAGRTYKGTIDSEGNKHNNINRVFATKKNGVTLYKHRLDNGLVKFADTPDNMFIWNNECDELENFKKIIDLNHYHAIATKKLKAWG